MTSRSEISFAVKANLGPILAVAATGWWLVEVTRAWAGRDAPSVTVGAILIAVALVALRPDRVLPRTAILLATAMSAGAFIVPLTAATGWAGSPDGAIYACGAWLAVVVAATVVKHPQTKVWLVTVVVASAAIEFMSGWLAWWGGEDPSHPMIGTFYWHNPYAAFLMPGGLLALAFWVWRGRIFALLGLLGFTFAAIGIVYSSSRATLACFVLGVLLVAALVLRGTDRWRRLLQLVIAVIVAAGMAVFVSGPPFFPHRASPFAAEQTRSVGQSLGQNGGYRIDFWREALGIFTRHPINGGGFKSLVAQSEHHVPASWPLSPYAHNGYLQPLAEGGLLLGLPFLLAVLALAFLCLRALVRGLVRRALPAESVVVAIALACVLLHSGVDFDWIYAADFAMAGVLAGLLLGDSVIERTGAGRTAEPGKPPRIQRVALGLCVVAGIGLLGVSAWVIRNGNHSANLGISAQAR